MDVYRQISAEEEQLARDIERTEFDYEYPDGLDLHPKSELHKVIVQRVRERVRDSRRVTDVIKTEWQKMDWALSAYFPMTEAESAFKSKNPGKPVSIVIPMTFASLETFLTYMSSIFLKDPIYRLVGRGSKEDKIKVALLERVLNSQNLWFKEGLHLQTQWRDAFTYGIGMVSPQWRKHTAMRPVNRAVDALMAEMLSDLNLGAEEGDVLQMVEEEVLFEGNELQNIDQYHAIYDPSATPNRIQNAEYVGWQESTNSMDLLTRETDPEEALFNCKAVRMLAAQGAGESVFWGKDESGRNTRSGADVTSGDVKSNTVHLTRLFIKLIPKEWGLGDGDRPEKWMFTVAGDAIVIQAQPLGLSHGMFPVAVAAPNTTGHDVLPISHLATTYGMQETIDWFIKAHVLNVRKSINDMLVFDPSRIEAKDVMDPKPGKLIRLKQSAYGSNNPIASAIQQLNVHDVTMNHTRDAMTFIDLLRQANGTVDVAMGDLSALPERPTKAGINAAQSGALSRLQRLAQIIAAQSMQDLAWQESYNTLQFMAQDVAVSIIGRYEQQLRREFGLQGDDSERVVSPLDLSANFAVEPHNAAMPAMDDMSAMTQVIQTALNVEGVAPEMIGGLDLMGLFLQWARKAGFENVHDFIKETGGQMNVQVMPDEQVQEQAQAGNLMPAEGLV